MIYDLVCNEGNPEEKKKYLSLFLNVYGHTASLLGGGNKEMKT